MTPVWKDADEAAYKWPQENPDPLSTILSEVDDLYHSDKDYAYKAGYFYRVIQILKAEREKTFKD